MQAILSVLVVFLHTLLAWVLVEVYVNHYHALPRAVFVLLHYVVVFAAFAIVFGVYARFFGSFSPFVTTVIAMLVLFATELVVFRFFYTGNLWFFNYVDWIVPVFLAASAVYFAGTFAKP